MTLYTILGSRFDSALDELMLTHSLDVTARGEDMFVLDFRYMFFDTDSVVYPQTCHVLGVPVTNMYVGWSLTCMWGPGDDWCQISIQTIKAFTWVTQNIVLSAKSR